MILFVVTERQERTDPEEIVVVCSSRESMQRYFDEIREKQSPEITPPLYTVYKHLLDGGPIK